jgi:hydroxymethylbilane synthase
MRTLVLGTRGSALALWQARHIATLLIDTHSALQIDERIIKTEGDIQQQQPLLPGNRGVFVRAIENELLEGRIDLAVHSMKDLPTTQPEGLTIAAVPRRADPRDVLLTREGIGFEKLPAGSVIATGSFRRRTQLLHARPDLLTKPVRGNVDSRIRKLQEGRFAALALALAGIQRLGIDSVPYEVLDPSLCLPAVGQGALALETRADDRELHDLLRAIEHHESRAAVEAERAFLNVLGGGCLAPATAYAFVENGSLRMKAAVGDPDGEQLMRESDAGELNDAALLGGRLAKRMLGKGAGKLLELARNPKANDGER